MKSFLQFVAFVALCSGQVDAYPWMQQPPCPNRQPPPPPPPRRSPCCPSPPPPPPPPPPCGRAPCMRPPPPPPPPPCNPCQPQPYRPDPMETPYIYGARTWLQLFDKADGYVCHGHILKTLEDVDSCDDCAKACMASSVVDGQVCNGFTFTKNDNRVGCGPSTTCSLLGNCAQKMNNANPYNTVFYWKNM